MTLLKENENLNLWVLEFVVGSLGHFTFGSERGLRRPPKGREVFSLRLLPMFRTPPDLGGRRGVGVGGKRDVE